MLIKPALLTLLLNNLQHRAIRYGPDEEGINGIYLGKNVVTEASKGLKKALTAIGPKVSEDTDLYKLKASEGFRKLEALESMSHAKI